MHLEANPTIRFEVTQQDIIDTSLNYEASKKREAKKKTSSLVFKKLQDLALLNKVDSNAHYSLFHF